LFQEVCALYVELWLNILQNIFEVILKDVVVFGTGGHSKVVYDAINKQGVYRVAAFVSLSNDLENFLGIPHFHQSKFSKINLSAGVVAIGDNTVRADLVKFIKSINNNFEFVTVVHPSASIANGVRLGVGTVVMAQVAVNIDTVVGEHCILNTSSSIDHDCRISDFSSVAPRAVLGGNVHIEKLSVVSIGAVVKHGCKIGENSVLGAGATLLSDLQSNAVAYGTPAKFIRSRVLGEKYL
jgi:sugar O-acyltransferase (sialic acid O-acetyltransferase NeuD family)